MVKMSMHRIITLVSLVEILVAISDMESTFLSKITTVINIKGKIFFRRSFFHRSLVPICHRTLHTVSAKEGEQEQKIQRYGFIVTSFLLLLQDLIK